MQLDKRRVESAICSKGFRIDNSHHRYFIYYTLDGRRTSVVTHTSHGAQQSINGFLIAKMAKQCKLQKAQFVDLVNCPLSREEYESMLLEQKHITPTE